MRAAANGTTLTEAAHTAGLASSAHLSAAFRDTFTEVSEHPFIANGPTRNSDGCRLDPVLVFPDCRIDHVLLSPGAPWKTRSWSVDVFLYPRGFASDHRAIVVDLE